MPEISVLIPVYNREDCIVETIQSVISQDHVDLEVIICDNASTDNTWDLCRHWAAKDSRIKIFQNETNIGPVKNWKACIDKATGRFAKLLFSDDLVLPGSLASMIEPLKNPEIGLVLAPIVLGETPEDSRVVHKWFSQDRAVASREFLSQYHNRKSTVSLSPCAALFRLSDLRDQLKWEFTYAKMEAFAATGAGPDLRLYWDIAVKYPEIYYLSKPMTFFRDHAGSISVSHVNSKSTLLQTCYMAAALSFLIENDEMEIFCNEVARQRLTMSIGSRRWLSLAETYSRLKIDTGISPGLLHYTGSAFRLLTRHFRSEEKKRD